MLLGSIKLGGCNLAKGTLGFENSDVEGSCLFEVYCSSYILLVHSIICVFSIYFYEMVRYLASSHGFRKLERLVENIEVECLSFVLIFLRCEICLQPC